MQSFVRYTSLRIAFLLLWLCPVSAQVPSSGGPSPAYAPIVHVAVTSGGSYLDGLGAGDFQFIADDRPVRADFLGIDPPTSVVVVLDVSESMRSAKPPEVLRAVVAGLDELDRTGKSPREYTIVAASTEVRALSGFVAKPSDLSASQPSLPPRNNTALYDACALAAATLRDRHTTRHVLVVVSDGADNSSKATLATLKRRLVEENILLYGVYLYPAIHPPSDVELEYGGRTLDDLAETTGGSAVLSKGVESLAGTFKAIGVDLSNRYSFRVEMPVRERMKENRLEVRAAGSASDARLRIRKVCYPPSAHAATP